jgi:hypothetical protein
MMEERGDMVVCDDCGFEEPATRDNSSRYSAATNAAEFDDE